MTMSELEARIQVLEDIEEIRKLKATYCYLCDAGLDEQRNRDELISRYERWTELNAADFFRANKMTMKPVVIESTPELAKAFFAGRCDCLTSDASQLAGTRAVAPKPEDYIILPEIISREPLAPAVRHGDDQWYDIVNFAIMAMIEADAHKMKTPE